MRKKLKSNGYAALLNYAFWLLARRDYGEKELLKKLRQKTKLVGGEEYIPRVHERLKELGYLDDEKFAKLFLESRATISPRGKYLLRYELAQKGIPKEIFEKLWEEGRYSEQALALNLLEQKKRLLSRLSGEKRKKKIFAILSSRGFPGDVIYDLADWNAIFADFSVGRKIIRQ